VRIVEPGGGAQPVAGVTRPVTHAGEMHHGIRSGGGTETTGRDGPAHAGSPGVRQRRGQAAI
jgi:hypothetical protein